MAAKIPEGKSLKREIRVYGIEQPVVVTLTNEGVCAQVKGSRIAVETGWAQIIGAMNTPGNVPSYLSGKAYQFLKQQAEKTTARKVKKIDATAKSA